MRSSSAANRIYLDHAATTPLRAEVQEAMQPHLGGAFGNASSLHAEGRAAREALERARKDICKLCHAEDFHLVFTGSGTEADNSALIGAVRAVREGSEKTTHSPIHVVTTAIEHAAVLESAMLLESLGVDVTLVGVGRSGRVPPDAVEAAMRGDTRLVSVMAVNNETGVTQDLADIGRRVRDRGALFHTDAVQLLGKEPLDLTTLPADLVSVSAHKIYGPKGVGALFVRKEVDWRPLLRGGTQEGGLRGGTENVAGAVGFARALALVEAERSETMPRLGVLRNRLENAIVNQIEDALVNGAPEQRVETILNCSFPRVEGESLARRLDHHGIAVSTGSACNVGAHKPSHVLKAMGRSAAEIRGSIRFSLGKENDASQIDAVIPILVKAVKTLQELAPGD